MKKKIMLALLYVLALLILAGCAQESSEPTHLDEAQNGQTEEQPPADVSLEGNSDESGFPIPDGATFGLTGEEAILYSAAAQVLCADTIEGDLMLPSITLYGQYDGDDGSTNYVCGLLRMYYYDLDLTDPAHPSYSGIGGAGRTARITISDAGVCTAIEETYDGETREGQIARINELCGPLSNLAVSLNDDSTQGKRLISNDYREMLSAYVERYF